MSKTNFEYLREMLSTEEQKEFLDAIEESHNALEKKVEKSNKLTELARKELASAEAEIEDLENQELLSLCNKVQTGLDPIYWKADNLLLQQEIESFMEQLKAKYP